MGVRDPFETLGVERRFDLDRDALERRFRDLQRALHPDKHVGGTSAERRMSLERAMAVNEAYRALRDELTRAEALLRVSGVEPRHEGTGGDPAFLMEMMELRESLADARTAGDPTVLPELKHRVGAMREASLRTLSRGFAASPDRAALEGLRVDVEHLRYYRRFLEELDAIEEAAST